MVWLGMQVRVKMHGLKKNTINVLYTVIILNNKLNNGN